MSSRPVALTGVKSTGTPHLGNYLGAIRPAIELTREHQGVFFIADYHSLTSERDGAALRESTYDVAATWLALGLDPKEAIFFKQSDIPEVCELAWVLSCFTGLGALNRAHAYKDAVAKGREVNHGLFAYPVLMAADILLYESDVVPVGKDQKQHVEMCREMAQSINHNYGEDTLKVPEPLIKEDVGTVTGLDGRKMSKSYGNTIPLFLPPKQSKKRFMKIVTGSESLEDKKDPSDCNVMKLYRLFASPDQVRAMEERYRAGGLGYGSAKTELFELYEEHIRPRRERYDELMANRDHIDELLRAGAERAREVANRVLDRLRDRCGFTPGR